MEIIDTGSFLEIFTLFRLHLLTEDFILDLGDGG